MHLFVLPDPPPTSQGQILSLQEILEPKYFAKIVCLICPASICKNYKIYLARSSLSILDPITPRNIAANKLLPKTPPFISLP